MTDTHPMHISDALQQRLADVATIHSISAVLDWDQQTYMPPGGAERRAGQIALTSKLAHDLLVSSETERLLAAAERDGAGLDPDSDEAAYLRVARRDFDRAAKLPTSLVEELAGVAVRAHEHWVAARAASDYARFSPWLARILDLERRVVECLGYKTERYDALLDAYEPEMTAGEVRTMFEALKPSLVALVRDIRERGRAVDREPLTRDFDEGRQREFAERVIREFGFDFQRGRQDRTVHPFCTSFSRDDVRITTRYNRRFLPMALFGTLHETGHALYEQGVAERYDGNVLASGASLGVHESQSRLWENLVGRSRPFWTRYYPDLQAQFPALSDVTLDAFYSAINLVEPSLIRVEADEVTYNLHILLRFEMEVELLEGRLSVDDAPAAWNARSEAYLGLTPPSDADGILQDVHWSSGGIGYFPTYTLGNVLSVQLFEAANAALGGEVDSMVARGEFAPLREWLRENVHQWGRKYTPEQLIRRATGRPLDTAPYLRYLRTKFGRVYGL
ncbi:MAG: carboxypeptidase M32 [Capsulimonadaceae bacterium]